MNAREHADSLLRFTRTISDMILKDWPQDKYTFQNTPNDNHVLWVLGHIACTDVWIGSQVGADIKVPESFSKLFGGGAKPTPSAKDYPAFAEIRSTFDQNRAKLLAWFASATEPQLSVSLKEKSGGFANDPIDAILKSAWHEGWHFGQLATLRQSLGLPNVLG